MVLSDPCKSAEPRGSSCPLSVHRLAIPSGETVTIDEQSDDVLMFGKFGMSIAMGNAPDEVKVAIAVTASYDDEGFA